jgi:hypothetical protein
MHAGKFLLQYALTPAVTGMLAYIGIMRSSKGNLRIAKEQIQAQIDMTERQIQIQAVQASNLMEAQLKQAVNQKALDIEADRRRRQYEKIEESYMKLGSWIFLIMEGSEKIRATGYEASKGNLGPMKEEISGWIKVWDAPSEVAAIQHYWSMDVQIRMRKLVVKSLNQGSEIMKMAIGGKPASEFRDKLNTFHETHDVEFMYIRVQMRKELAE